MIWSQYAAFLYLETLSDEVSIVFCEVLLVGLVGELEPPDPTAEDVWSSSSYKWRNSLVTTFRIRGLLINDVTRNIVNDFVTTLQV